MLIKKTATHARASLLDRLIDQEPESQEESRPLRALPIREWKQAFLRDLEWLLNTYCPIVQEELAKRQRTVIDYGMMDFSTFFTHSTEDHQKLVELFKNTLSTYEPRLKDVSIKISSKNNSLSHNELQVGLDARLDATLLMDGVEEPISFRIKGGHHGGVKIVNE